MTQSTVSEFNCNIAIVNPSPTTKDMMRDLPDNYTQSQNSNIFTLLYGAGYEIDNLKRTLRQLEANNYLYSPDTQQHSLKIDGAGSYLIEFDVPFVIPPLNVSISGADYSDVYIEYADRFSMVVSVLTDITDVLTWSATGFVGAASDEVLGDALYQNFGALFNFPRQGDSEIDETFVNRYKDGGTYLTVETITPNYTLLGVSYVDSLSPNYISPYNAAFNQTTGKIDTSGFPNQSGFSLADAQIYSCIVQRNLPPVNNTYLTGYIQLTTAITDPLATHELLDAYGNVQALLDASTVSTSISAYYANSPANSLMSTYPSQINLADPAISLQSMTAVYVAGFESTYTFNKWDQLSYQQEVFRADNKYRRLLAGINLSLQEGPSKTGIANIVETLFAQPYIPADYWAQSDFRVFENTQGQSTPKYLTAMTANFATEFDSYPAPPAIVEIQNVQNSWSPNSITFNNAPKSIPIPSVDGSALTTTLPITSLNSASRFDITSKLITDLRLGFDPNSYPQGGVLNWNYANFSNSSPGVNTGFPFYENNNNFVFLNSSNDSYAGIKLFYYFALANNSAQGNIQNYGCYGPLQYNSDYAIVATNTLLVPGTTATYYLPSDLLRSGNYAANAYGSNNGPYNPNDPTTTYNFITPFYSAGVYKDYWTGYDDQQANPSLQYNQLPSFLIQLKLDKANRVRFNTNGFGIPENLPIYLLNTNDFLIYSYAEMGVNSTTVNGNFVVSSEPQYVAYYDSSPSQSIIQPIGSPFINRNIYSIAQTPLAKFQSPTNYPYNLTMLGGQVTFNKTALTSNLISIPTINTSTGYLPQNNYYAVNDTNQTNATPIIFHLLGLQITTPASFAATLATIPMSAAGYTAPFYFQIGDNSFAVQGFLDKNVQITTMTNSVNNTTYSVTNQVTQLEYGTYVIRQVGTGAVLAIIDDSSEIFGELNQLWEANGTSNILIVTGLVYHTIWDTRIPISYYASYPPVFQASNNYGADISTFTPEEDTFSALTGSYITTTFNKNFLVIIDGLPGGNQETVTASWSFAIQALSQSTTVQNQNTIGFSDTSNGPGIMSLYCGRTAYTLTQQGSAYVDLDNATYNQSYTSPFFSGYFLNYKDYIGELGSPTVSPTGDANTADTLTANYNSQYNNVNSVINFFSPSYGFISISILPDMTFSNALSNSPITVMRPNNNGLKMMMVNPSRSGLVFYGKNGNKIVDKPTRLVITYTYDAADSATRKKIVQIEDGGYAAWTDALNPNTVNPNDTFYVTGNQYKYAHNGFDQPESIYQYQDTFNEELTINNYPSYEAIATYGNTPYGYDTSKQPAPGYQSYSCYPNEYNEYSGVYQTNPPTYYPLFQIDPTIAPNSSPGETGTPGTPQRYRHAAQPLTLNTVSGTTAGLTYSSYVNPGPQKDSYFQFDLSTFPYDTTITDATLEIYFASGFTVRDSKDLNFTLNSNKAWEKSRLSGNGRTYNTTVAINSNNLPVIKPLNNVHWRKNYYEILVPYAFLSEPTDINYGIRNYFGNATNNNLVPGPTNPIQNLEYLGFVNIDEIDTSQLTPSTTNLVETTVGLANVVLNQNSLIYMVTGILTFNYITINGVQVINPINNNVATDLNFYETVVYTGGNNIYTVTPIAQNEILPNQKVLVFPYGISNTFFYYGYVKSVLPSTLIGFTDSDIAIYRQALEFVSPIYSQYTVKLLEADTYFPYTTFGRDTQVSDTPQDISY